jgi:hypothetical protein
MNLEAQIVRAILDVVEAVLFHNPAVEDPRKLALDLAAEKAHEIAITAEIDRELAAKRGGT